MRARPRPAPAPGAGPLPSPPEVAGESGVRTIVPVHERYEVNTPEVIEESVDGEVLIVHLGTGAYYSSDGSGEFIWRRIVAGQSAPEVCAEVASAFALDEAVSTATVERMLGQYREEGLIRERAEGRPVDLVTASANGAFEEPILNKYTDMEELLLLDPVHDVEEAGWPHARPDLNRA